jgi:hypothetical protein
VFLESSFEIFRLSVIFWVCIGETSWELLGWKVMQFISIPVVRAFLSVFYLCLQYFKAIVYKRRGWVFISVLIVPTKDLIEKKAE